MAEERSTRKKEEKDKKDWRFSLELFQAVLCIFMILIVFLFCKFKSNGKQLLGQAFDYLSSVSVEQSVIDEKLHTVSAFFSFGEDAED